MGKRAQRPEARGQRTHVGADIAKPTDFGLWGQAHRLRGLTSCQLRDQRGERGQGARESPVNVNAECSIGWWAMVGGSPVLIIKQHVGGASPVAPQLFSRPFRWEMQF
jgi:hypothetical protein